MYGTTCAIAVFATLLVSGLPGPSSDPADGWPFDLFQQHLVVTKAAIGPLNDLSVLIDTGTIPSVVDHRIAQKLRLQTVGSRLVAFGRQVAIKSAVLDDIRIGSLQSGPVPAAVGDLSYLGGGRVDAIVGLDVLARSSFTIDYQAHRLHFLSDAREESAAPLEFVWPFVTVRMAIAGRPVRLLVDTGSPDLVLFKARMPAALSNAPWRGDKTVQYASGPARLTRLDLRNPGLGTYTWDKLSAWVLDRPLDGYPDSVDGVLGIAALRCRRVRFDFERGELSWTL
jgi:predicted aspartyl protease